MSRLLRGKSVPGTTNTLRIAWATKIPPDKLFQLAGNSELAGLCREITWTSKQVSARNLYSVRDAGIHERVQRLLDLGFAPQVKGALSTLEQGFETLRPSFESFAKSVEAKAAVLIADSPRRKGDILFTWNVSAPRAEKLRRGALEGWKVFDHEEEDLSLSLCLLQPGRTTRRRADIALGLWAASLMQLYRSNKS